MPLMPIIQQKHGDVLGDIQSANDEDFQKFSFLQWEMVT